MKRIFLPLWAVTVALLAFTNPAAALSWPLCEDGGQVWVTERPHTELTFPGANLWFFCEGGSLNVLGDAISACVQLRNGNSEVCGAPVAQAVCLLLGYERAFDNDTVLEPAALGEPVVTLTGQFCIRRGQYGDSLPENLADVPGQPCDKISKLTCLRSLNTMAAAAALGLQNAESLSVLQAAPSAEGLTVTAVLAQRQVEAASSPATEGPEAVIGPTDGVGVGGGGGRRLQVFGL